MSRNWMVLGLAVVVGGVAARGAGTVEKEAGAKYAGFAYAAGWPVRVEGRVAATPVLCDLMGDGKKVVVVPVLRQTEAGAEGTIYVMDASGALVPGWPVAVGVGPKAPWTASPSVFKAGGRVFVYNTGLAIHAGRMQWPTHLGGFSHTGVWKKGT